MRPGIAKRRGNKHRPAPYCNPLQGHSACIDMKATEQKPRPKQRKPTRAAAKDGPKPKTDQDPDGANTLTPLFFFKRCDWGLASPLRKHVTSAATAGDAVCTSRRPMFLSRTFEKQHLREATPSRSFQKLSRSTDPEKHPEQCGPLKAADNQAISRTQKRATERRRVPVSARSTRVPKHCVSACFTNQNGCPLGTD